MKQAIFEKVEDFRRNGRVKKKWQWKTLEEEVAVEDFRRGGILRAWEYRMHRYTDTTEL